MKIRVIIEKGKDGTFGMFSDNLKCCVVWGDGKTIEEAKEDFDNTFKETIESYVDDNEEVPKELINPTFEYKYDVASIFSELDYINISKFAKVSGINASLLRHYKKGDYYISKKQVMRIEEALHKIGRQLLAASLL